MWTIKQCFLRLVPVCAEISCCLLSAAAGLTLQFPCDQSHSSGKENGHLSPNITSARLLLINLFARSTATLSCHRGVSWRSSCPDAAILSYTFVLLFTGKKAGLEDNEEGDICCSPEWPNHSSGRSEDLRSAAWRKRECQWRGAKMLLQAWAPPNLLTVTGVIYVGCSKRKATPADTFFFFFFAKSQTPTVLNKK